MRVRFDPRGIFNLRVSRGSSEAYILATAFIVIAALVRLGLGFIGPVLLPFTTFYPALLFATYIGGLWVGCFAAIVGGLVAWWAFLPPHYAFFPISFTDELELLAYGLASAVIIWATDSYRKLADNYRGSAEHLQNEEKLRKIAVDELAHRLKNKIATIQSIVSYQLREQPQLRDDIVARLVALSATDDLIMATQGKGADFRDVLATELGAYEVSRVSMDGPAVFLPAKLAMTMALLVHELATNAAKYGSLSTQGGMVSLNWSISEDVLKFFWRETGGPTVTKPARRGFGLRLLSDALGQFKGSSETVFEPTGLVCKINATLPGSALNLASGAGDASTEALAAE